MTADLEPLWRWATRRETARLCKERGLAPPYSADSVIAEWRFCNVRREDDRVTIWIRENVRERFAGHPYLWFMLCCARAINWPDTLAELINDKGRTGAVAWPHEASTFEPCRMGEVLQTRAQRGEKVFTGAYLITAPPTKGAKKTTFVAEKTLGNLWRARDKITQYFDAKNEPTLRSVHGALTYFNGWGPFMAYQVVVDMRFTPLLRDAPDVSSWAAAGPGTLRGLNRLHGRRPEAPLAQDRALGLMREIFAFCPSELGFPVDFSDVPNMLCETDKYLRVINGEGTPRARYVPERGS